MKCYEVNFDALVGPTHHYGGLSYGNVASVQNQMSPSNPQLAALQGLEKMRFLNSLGLKQGIVPPHPRPHISTLRQLGYYGPADEVLINAGQEIPEIFKATGSAACMFAANSATLTPSCDSRDGRVQITPANLSSKFHRSIETPHTAKLLRHIFADPLFFKHHPPLPSGSFFSDEGTANHSCFNQSHGKVGVHLFVYGRHSFSPDLHVSKHFPSRQTFEASQAISRLHQLNPASTIFFQQSPQAIDAGVFHNDVIAVGNNHLFLFHELAFFDCDRLLQNLQKAVLEICHVPLLCIKVSNQQVSLEDAVRSYLFNSQLVTLPDGTMALIAPMDCQEIPSVMVFLKTLIQDNRNPINQVYYFNLRESMRNGGGPACLRLRIVLTEQELQAVNPHFLFTEKLYESLSSCIQQHYRTYLTPADLADPAFFEESQQALMAIYRIFGIEQLGT